MVDFRALCVACHSDKIAPVWHMGTRGFYRNIGALVFSPVVSSVVEYEP